MSGVSDVWRALDGLVSAGADGALVTVAHTEGSAYQREGAKLLFREGADPIGTISGGCLEADLFEHCRAAVARGEPNVVRYDTGGASDTLFGGGTGCQGTVELLIEPVACWREPQARTLAAAGGRGLAHDRRVVIATLVRRDGVVPHRLPRVLAGCEGEPLAAAAEPPLLGRLLDEARAALGDRSRRPSRKIERTIAGGRCEILVDVAAPAPRLIVLGAGEDARPLVRIAAASGMDVAVVDWRRELVSAERLPEAATRVCARPEEFPAGLSLEGRPAVLLMTHNYLADAAALERLATRPDPLSYLGVLGPRSRTARLLSDLARIGGARTLDARTPAGLDLGADSPEEIALSIVAEVLAVRRGGSGRPLRDLGGVESKGGR